MFRDIFPPIETVLELEPEELAPFVLKHLSGADKINRYNYTLGSSSGIQDYAGEHLRDFQKRLMEAFVWLEREIFLAPLPDEQGEWRYITKRGEEVLKENSFLAYSQGLLLPSENLHSILVKKVKHLFLRGDYDVAIFQAFKSVEVLVRDKGGYDKSDIGVPLMRKAFHPDTGKLTNSHSGTSERQAMMELFSGAIGLFKNPTSHRFIDEITPTEAAGYIMVANCLLKMVDDNT